MTAGSSSTDVPLLSDEQIDSLAVRGTRHETGVGELLYQAGDSGYDFVVIESGTVDVVRPAMPDTPEAHIATWGAGRFWASSTSSPARPRSRPPGSAPLGSSTGSRPTSAAS